MIEPFLFGASLEGVERDADGQRVKELSEASLMQLLKEGREVQSELCEVPLEERLQALDWLGELWKERQLAGELTAAKEALELSTGYPSRLIDLEFSLVPKVLRGEEIGHNLEASLIGGKAALERFVDIQGSEAIRHLPSGPAFIMSSGNSIIPTLIPTVVSHTTGNFTVLKPSLSNYRAVFEVFSGFKEIAPRSPAAHLMARSLCISYFTHDSPGLISALGSAPFGVVNYWGGEPGRSLVAARLAQNPNHPRLFVNGPLTGIAVIGPGGDSEDVARGLALNMVLYEQQLCSSPTMGIYIGGYDAALRFASMVRNHLESIGPRYPVDPSNDALFVTNSARRVMALKGSKVLHSNNVQNPWTLAITKAFSNLDPVVTSFPSFSVHGRRRFLELVVVDSLEGAVSIVKKVPSMAAFAGVDKVQTIGLALAESGREEAVWAMAATGSYRIVPVEDMFMRSASEPYDGVGLASLFTYTVYERRSPLEMEDIL
ncbi:MAG TPA: acyl-CoA reductase [Methanomassiliicoccales archaeon]|nr:acyl-CoA reductase [Methanomassiliicoccales archaeon]